MKHDPSRYRSKQWKLARLDALRRAGWKCEKCGKAGRLEVHHKVRIADGGTDELENLQCLCRKCHFAKHEKTPGRAEWKAFVDEL